MAQQLTPPPIFPQEKLARWYSPERFGKKILTIAKKAGDKIIVLALTLFYCLQDKDTPRWARGVIIGALGYLILPADLIPDIIPGAGLTDDWGTLIAALGTVAVYVKEIHKEKAREQRDKIIAKITPKRR
jgi:uncharacterized membrane protein YkvA (DUF1232 family)